jgi:hypothetical protein
VTGTAGAAAEEGDACDCSLPEGGEGQAHEVAEEALLAGC